MNGFISEFGLTYKQTCLLFSLERQIVENDIISSKANNKFNEAAEKQAWLNTWTVNINNFLENLDESLQKKDDNSLTKKTGVFSNFDISKFDEKELLQKIFSLLKLSKIANKIIQNKIPSKFEVSKADNKKLLSEILKDDSTGAIRAWRYLILLECTLFTPYYTFDSKDIDNDGFINSAINHSSKLSLNEEAQNNSLVIIAELLNIDIKYIDIFKKRYQESLRSLSGFWTKVMLAGGTGMLVAVAIVLFFINPIAAAFAAPGLSGAAAFSAGMAALGGGAIAAGGFGIAGGVAVLVGGAMILGGSTGLGIGALASVTPKIVLTELAKIEVVLKEIIIGTQQDFKIVHDVIHKLYENLAEMKREIEVLKLENEKNKDKIKNLKEAIKYLTNAIGEFQKL